MSDGVPSARESILARRLAGVGLAIAAAALDQASKLWLLNALPATGEQRITLTWFCDLILMWNTGISYSLLPQTTTTGRWLLVAFTFAAVIGLLFGLLRAKRWIMIVPLALIIGGAVGNGIDRIVYGAVVDFVYLHVGRWSWYVFNLGDTWIVFGGFGLLYDALRPARA